MDSDVYWHYSRHLVSTFQSSINTMEPSLCKWFVIALRLSVLHLTSSRVQQSSRSLPHIHDNVLTPSCPELCRCKGDVADCSGNYGNLSFVPALPNNIAVLIFSLNNLTSINNDTFFSNVTNITGLDLSSNGLSYICNGTFVPLKRLHDLVLNYNNIKVDMLQVVLSIKTLVHLNLTHTNLEPWVYDLFYHHPLPFLETIDMCNNTLKNLNLTAFAQYRNITNIYIGSCYISDVISDSMPSLKNLSFFDNGILFFPETCGNGTSLFPNLQQLILNANVLHDIPENICLPNLTSLDLSRNRFTRIQPFTFSELRFPRLRVLILEVTIAILNYVIFENNAFSSLTLETISLAGSRIPFSSDNVFDPSAFSNSSALTEIQLDSNNFRGITDANFYNLFGQLTSLKKLYLDYCRIYTITENTFKAVPFIQEIYLHGNTLTSIPDGAFDGLNSLTLIDLSQNMLLLIREATFNSATRQRLQHINLSNNSFICSCDIKWFQQWLISDKTVFDNTSFYQCSNLPNTNLADFYLPDQACLLSSDAFTVTLVSVSLVLITLTVTAIFYRLRWKIRLLLYETFRGRTEYRQHYLLTCSFQYDVFVSYAAADLDWVLTYLMPELEERNGVKLCIHQRDFLPGKNIVDNIVDNLEKSKKVMLVFSSHYARSQWCQFELTLCLQHVMKHDDILVVVCLEDLHNRMLTGTMLALLQVTTYIIWEDDTEARASFWGRIRIALHEIIP